MTTETEEALARRAELEAALHHYVAARNARQVYDNQVTDIGRELKEWLEANPGEVLVDGEHGITALLQERDAPGRGCDFNAIWEHDPQLLIQLVQNGCLRLDEAAVKRAGALVGGIDRYLAPKSRTTALQVKESR